MAFNVAVTEKVEQPLLSRTVMKGLVTYDSAPPSFVELRKHIARSLKLDESVVVVSSCIPVFGSRKSGFEGFVYRTKQDADKFSSRVVLARNQPRVKKASAAAAAATAATATAEKK